MVVASPPGDQLQLGLTEAEEGLEFKVSELARRSRRLSMGLPALHFGCSRLPKGSQRYAAKYRTAIPEINKLPADAAPLLAMRTVTLTLRVVDPLAAVN